MPLPPLHQTIATDHPTGTGGKGASLRWLSDTGYACSPFVLIDACVWAATVARPALARDLATIRYGGDQLPFSMASLSLRRAATESPLPEAVQAWLADDPFATLGPRLAVRSSALSEDGASSSSAGQYESILGVTSLDGLNRAIREVAASYYGERAILYRRSHRIDDGDRLAMGIIVQSMVSSAVAGIAFSEGTTDETRASVLIDASWGLGPTVVGGETQPDHFVVPRFGTATEEILTTIGRKSCALTFDEAQRVLVKTELPPSAQPCLSPAQARQIASDVICMQEQLGYPVDVEWALPTVDSDPVYLQVRPITTAIETPPVTTTLTSAF